MIETCVQVYIDMDDSVVYEEVTLGIIKTMMKDTIERVLKSHFSNDKRIKDIVAFVIDEHGN